MATAAAQVMRYWNYPTQGPGSHSYSWAGQTLSANFGDTAYDWANMPDALSVRSTQAQKVAVATLCYEVAVAVDMDFAPDGSGAYTVDTAVVKPVAQAYIDVVPEFARTAASNVFNNIEDLVSASRPIIWIDRILGALARLWPSLFAYNFLVVARRLPTLDLMLDLSQRLGFRLSLEAIATATLGTGKSADGAVGRKRRSR